MKNQGRPIYNCTKDGRNPKNVRASSVPEARMHYIVKLEWEENIRVDDNSIVVCERVDTG